MSTYGTSHVLLKLALYWTLEFHLIIKRSQSIYIFLCFINPTFDIHKIIDLPTFPSLLIIYQIDVEILFWRAFITIEFLRLTAALISMFLSYFKILLLSNENLYIYYIKTFRKHYVKIYFMKVSFWVLLAMIWTSKRKISKMRTIHHRVRLWRFASLKSFL